jgi:tetratricopeptide (TPR) repeat protein
MAETPQPLFTADEEAELLPLLTQGKVILFLGVGFSVNAKNKSGKSIPTAATLATQMNQILVANGETGFQGNNLYDLKLVSESFYRFNKEFPKAIDIFFKTNLTVDRENLPPNYNNLKKINWNGIYTTNYDDLLEAIYESSLEGKVTFKKSTYKRTNSDLPDDNAFNIVYLNGDLNCNARLEVPNDVIVTDLVCSITDFATSKTPEGWNYFIDKFRQCPIIIVGSQLNEDSFYSKFGELINKTNIQSARRPKSYIINIDVDDQKFVELKNTYNLHHKVADTNKFLEWIESKKELTNSKLEITIPNNIPTKKTSNSFIEFTKEYWEGLKGKKSTEDLIKYYTNINSSPLLLPYVVAEEFYIEPNEEIVIKSVSLVQESVRVNLDTLLPKKTGNHNCIIRINANGGTGKSTLLQHIGKKYFDKYHILYFKELTDTSTFPAFTNDNIPVIILLDNYGKQLEKLKQFSQRLNEMYFERGYCLITTERHLRESILDSEIKKEIDENFSEIINCTINHSSIFYEKIFDKIIQFIDKENSLSVDRKAGLRARLADSSKATTAERIIDFLISIKHSNLGFQFSFDWEDWEKLCEENSDLSNYSNLYSIVAAFNNYDITPPIKFCIDLLGINDPNLIATYSLFSRPSFDFPISIQKDKCFELRNPNLAEWYIKEKDSLGSLTKKYFQDALGDVNTYQQMYFLRNTYRNHYVLRDSNLKALIPDKETLLKLFKEYITANPSDIDNSKNKMEMVVINLKNHDKAEAKVILYEMIFDSSENIHARTKLADILIQDKDYEEAKPIITFLTEKDPTNNYILKLRIAILKHSADEVSVIKELLKVLPKENKANIKYLYAKLAKLLRLSGDLIEAEEYCNKLIELNPLDYAAMNTLAMIYQKQNKFKEAEELLLKSIDIQPYNSHNYNELGQVYLQRYDSTDNIEFKYKAFDTFIKGLRIAKENIPLRTEFARFLMTYCNKFSFAKSILQYNIQKDPNHFHSYTELGKLYQKQYLFQKSKEVLEEGIKHIVNGIVRQENIPMLVILGNTYLELKEFDKAEKSFQKTIDLKQSNWTSHIGIAKALLKQNKIHDYENEFEKILAGNTEIVSLCDLANWLRGNNRIDDSKKIISKAKELNGDTENFYINTIHARILLEKILQLNRPDSIEVIQLNGQCENICLATLATKPNHEQTLHILYRLNLFFREKTRENLYLRRSYSKKYKKYLGKLFLLNRTSPYVFEGVSQHLKTTRRYRLAIAFLKKYGDININPFLYVGQLTIFFGFLGNIKELKSLSEFASANKFRLPNINLFENIELVSQDNIGFLIGDKIKSESKIYDTSIVNRNINYTAEALSKQSEVGIKVFFGLYKINGNLVANCIEPFFESIPKDDTALKLLELDSEYENGNTDRKMFENK